jgi:curved DNA-binding protein CbpA
MTNEGFINYYELMQISTTAELETIHRVYKILATRYHPDNPETGDVDKFVLLNEAYRVLSDPAARREYDLVYQTRHLEPIGIFNLREFALGIDGEENRRMGILCLLYNRRRANPDRPGLSVLELEKLMTFPREHLMFTVWYLKEKKLIRQGEESDFEVTSGGCDYVEEHLPKNKILYKLLKAAESGTVRVVVDEHADELSPSPAADHS